MLTVTRLISVLLLFSGPVWGDDDSDWVKLPNTCEVCKYLAVELKLAFEETGKTNEVIDTKYGFLEGKRSKIKYRHSDIRLIEVTENICNRLLEYNLHKERSGSNRFAKGMSETFQTLHGLVHKGVKVVMDIPYELWNETSAEVSDMKKQSSLTHGHVRKVLKDTQHPLEHIIDTVNCLQESKEGFWVIQDGGRENFLACDVMVEKYEDVIEDWYKNHQEEDLTMFLCERHVLKPHETGCLKEIWNGQKGDPAAIDEEEKKKKKKKKKSKSKEDKEGENKKEKKGKKKKKQEDTDQEGGKDMSSDDEQTQQKSLPSHRPDEL